MTDNENGNGAGQDTATGPQGAAAQTGEQQFAIQKLYLKDSSFETPSSPEIFREEWRPEVNVELNVRNTAMGESHYEVVLQVTVTARIGDKTAYLCEVHQAGIFGMSGFNDRTLQGLLGSYCPSMLFPYVREAVSDLTGKGGFPPLALAPVNFDALYTQEQARRQEQENATSESGGTG